MGYRIGDDAINLRGGGDGVVAIHLLHLPPADLAGGQCPVFVEGGEREGGPGPAAQHARRHADLAHTDPHGGRPARVHHLQHSQVVSGMVRHRRDLDDVGVHRGKPPVQMREIGGRLLEVVVAHDSLRGPVPWHACRYVVLEINIVGSFDDRRP